MYFISSKGNDNNSGLSKNESWATLKKISDFDAKPGDIFALEGGSVFHGNIDWSWKDIGYPTNPITITSYGENKATIISPQNQHGIIYNGLGGLRISNLILQGNQNSEPGYFGIYVETQFALIHNIYIENVEIFYYSSAGIGLLSASIDLNINDVTIDKCNLHHNTNAVMLAGIANLKLINTNVYENDWVGDSSAPIGGYGLSLFNCRDSLVERCSSNRNGLLTLNAGGHGGMLLENCDNVKVSCCFFIGNGDATGLDGQGIVLYGAHDCLVENCVTVSNLNGGISLFHDEWCRYVERCEIRDCVCINDVTSLALVGSVLDCTISNNEFYTHSFDGVYRKTMDVALNAEIEPTPDNKRVSVLGNRFNANGGALLLEASPGLQGIYWLIENIWDSTNPIISSRERTFSRIIDALTAEPIKI